MPTSPKKAAANRRNALKSTGPKTQRGKMFSRINAVTHGVFSQNLLLMKGENPTDFTAHRAAYRNHYRPSNQTEHFLVDRMILAAWRLARLAVLEPRLVDTHHRISQNSSEAALLLMQGYRHVLFGRKAFEAAEREAALEKTGHGYETTDPALLDPVAHAVIRDTEGGNAVTKMARYQTALERSFYRAFHELERLRAPAAPGNKIPNSKAAQNKKAA